MCACTKRCTRTDKHIPNTQLLKTTTTPIPQPCTGNPFFTTDTAAALRAAEIDADAFFKATKVDGVFTADPAKHADAKLLQHVSYRQVMIDNLQVAALLYEYGKDSFVSICMSL